MAANLLRKYSKSLPPWLIRFLGNIWFPYLGAGIYIKSASADYRHIEVVLKKRWYNRNYVGTQFGGSIYSMTDPFYMLALINNLGPKYIVWDKAAQIEFLKPGKSDLTAIFILDDSILTKVREQTEAGDKFIFELPVDVIDEQSEVIARVKKTLYVRKKPTKD